MLSIIASPHSKPIPFGAQNYFFSELITSAMSSSISIVFHAIDLINHSSHRSFILQNAQWQPVHYDLSCLIYDRFVTSDRSSHERHQRFLSELKAEHHNIFNSARLQALLNDKLAFSAFCIRHSLPCASCFSLEQMSQIMSTLYSGQRFFLKPRYGFGGSGIFLVSNKDSCFSIAECRQDGLFPLKDEIDAPDLIVGLLPEFDYVVSPEVPSLRFHGLPFDIRVIMQRTDIYSKPQIIGSVLRAGSAGNVISNLSASGSAFPIEILADLHSRKMMDDVFSICNALSDILSAEMEFFEIGIDVLISTDQMPYIIEANAKPARWAFTKIADNDEFDVSIRSQYGRTRTKLIRNIVTFAESIHVQ